MSISCKFSCSLTSWLAPAVHYSQLFHWKDTRTMMNRTRYSLIYVAGYLTTSGLGMTFAPQWSLDLLLSNGHYESAFVRMCGLFVIGLAAIVVQTIRLRLASLYSTLI